MIVIRYGIVGIIVFLEFIVYCSPSSYLLLQYQNGIGERSISARYSCAHSNFLFQQPRFNDSASAAPCQAVDGICGNYSGVFGIPCFRQMKSRQPQPP